MQPDEGSEEILDTGRPRGPRRVVLGTGVVLVAAALTAVLVAAHAGHGDHRAGPAPTTAPSSTIPSVLPVEPAAADTIGDTVYMVEDGVLATVDIDTGGFYQWHRVGAGDASTTYRVIADAAHHLVYVLGSRADSTAVGWFDSGALEQPGGEEVPAPVGGVALLDGFLYVSTPSGVLTIGQEPATAPYRHTPIRGGQELAADPTRHRLLIVHLSGAPASIDAQRPGGGTAQTAPAPFVKGDIVVLDGRIWALGFARTGAVVVRLDPRTLRPVERSPLADRLGPGAVVVATSPGRVLVRDGGGGTGLWCLDGTGAVRHFWPEVTGTPVLTSSGVYVVTAGRPLRRLASTGCTP